MNIKVGLASVLLSWSAVAGAASSDDAGGEAETREQSTADMEEIRVEGQRTRRNEAGLIMDLYQDRERGFRLYRAKKYEEAYPYLEQAASQGLKDAQAVLGYMYMWGLGVEQDNDKAIGWMGVAAKKRTMPVIQRFWRGMLKQIPEELMPEVERLVADYDARYGAEVTDTVCQSRHAVGTWRPAVECRVRNDTILIDGGFWDDGFFE